MSLWRSRLPFKSISPTYERDLRVAPDRLLAEDQSDLLSESARNQTIGSVCSSRATGVTQLHSGKMGLSTRLCSRRTLWLCTRRTSPTPSRTSNSNSVPKLRLSQLIQASKCHLTLLRPRVLCPRIGHLRLPSVHNCAQECPPTGPNSAASCSPVGFENLPQLAALHVFSKNNCDSDGRRLIPHGSVAPFCRRSLNSQTEVWSVSKILGHVSTAHPCGVDGGPELYKLFLIELSFRGRKQVISITFPGIHLPMLRSLSQERYLEGLSDRLSEGGNVFPSET